MSAVWEHSQQTLGARLVVLALADYAHDDGSNAYPSIATLAAKAHMSERNVQYALRKLEQAGEIERQGTHVSGTVVWRITLPGMGANTAPAKSAPGANIDTGGVQKSTSEQCKSCTQIVTLVEPSLEPSEDKAPSRGHYPHLFERFWKRYPRTNGTKRTAYGVWSRLSIADRAAADAGLDKWIASDHWREGFVVYAERYLGRRQWEDEPAPKSASPNGSNGLSPEESRQYAERARVLSGQVDAEMEDIR